MACMVDSSLKHFEDDVLLELDVDFERDFRDPDLDVFELGLCFRELLRDEEDVQRDEAELETELFELFLELDFREPDRDFEEHFWSFNRRRWSLKIENYFSPWNTNLKIYRSNTGQFNW